jgi:hypothetical protein
LLETSPLVGDSPHGILFLLNPKKIKRERQYISKKQKKKTTIYMASYGGIQGVCFTIGTLIVTITALLLPPTVGMERADKTTLTELPASQASTHTRVTEGGSARDFETAPVVTLFHHGGNLAFDRQQ